MKVDDLQSRIRKATAEADDPLRACVSKFFGIWPQIDASDTSKFFDDKLK